MMHYRHSDFEWLRDRITLVATKDMFIIGECYLEVELNASYHTMARCREIEPFAFADSADTIPIEETVCEVNVIRIRGIEFKVLLVNDLAEAYDLPGFETSITEDLKPYITELNMRNRREIRSSPAYKEKRNRRIIDKRSGVRDIDLD